jgi:hypothetical protein
MISTATDPKSNVFQGRENTGAATVFDSGRYDPVAFWEGRVQQAQADKDKLEQERKDKNKRLFEAIQTPSAITDIGKQQLYKLIDDGINTFADVLAAGGDIEDPTTDAGKKYMKWQAGLKQVAALDKAVSEYDAALIKSYTTNPDKYEQDAFEDYLKRRDAVTTLEEAYQIQREGTALVPFADIDAPLEAISIEPAYDIEYDKQGNIVKFDPVFDEERLKAQIDMAMTRPEYSRSVKKVENLVNQNKSYASPYEYYKARVIDEAKRKSQFVKPAAPKSDGLDIMFSGNTYMKGNWRARAYNEDGQVGVALDKTGGETNVVPPIRFELKDDTGAPIERDATIDKIYKDGDGYKARVKYEVKDGGGLLGGAPRTREVTAIIDMTEANWAKLETESLLTKEEVIGLINKQGGSKKQKASTTTKTTTSGQKPSIYE